MEGIDTATRFTLGRAAVANKWWTLAAVGTGVFMLLLDMTIVNVALPDIERAFDASLSDLQWVISAYALTLAAFLLTAGSLADLYGRRLLFVSGITIFTAGSLACGLATDSTFLAISRGVQGVGGAIMFSTSLALLAQAFQGKDRGTRARHLRRDHGDRGRDRPRARRVDHDRPVVALDLLRERPDRRARARDHAAARRRVAQPGGAAARLGRLRHLQRGARSPRVRLDPEPALRLGVGTG